jgi:hypothetical protein
MALHHFWSPFDGLIMRLCRTKLVAAVVTDFVLVHCQCLSILNAISRAISAMLAVHTPLRTLGHRNVVSASCQIHNNCEFDMKQPAVFLSATIHMLSSSCLHLNIYAILWNVLGPSCTACILVVSLSGMAQGAATKVQSIYLCYLLVLRSIQNLLQPTYMVLVGVTLVVPAERYVCSPLLHGSKAVSSLRGQTAAPHGLWCDIVILFV